MKDRIIIWALNKLLNLVEGETVEEHIRAQLKQLIFKLYEISLTPYLLDREIIAMSFNAKYTDAAKDLGINEEPSIILTRYYQTANKGDGSFMKEPFYRLLRQSKDSEIRKLKYRQKRTGS